MRRRADDGDKVGNSADVRGFNIAAVTFAEPGTGASPAAPEAGALRSKPSKLSH
jgi:hypothetical protein